MSPSETSSKYAIVGGSLFSTLPSLGAEDFLVSGIMAVFGALVSYLASLLFKRLHRLLQKSRQKKTP